ncbi:hypothetical protein J3F83DRAFT_754573 [Trichoderma novae-zelandiae]
MFRLFLTLLLFSHDGCGSKTKLQPTLLFFFVSLCSSFVTITSCRNLRIHRAPITYQSASRHRLLLLAGGVKVSHCIDELPLIRSLG